jgi:thymidine kinase
VGRIEVPGEITVCFGPMFSGKTEWLIRELVWAKFQRKKSVAFKPGIDDRGEGLGLIKGKRVGEFPAISVENPDGIEQMILALEKTKKIIRVVGIDEAQFFGSAIVEVVERLSNMGKRVVVAGLPTDFRGEPFGSIPALIAIADKHVQLTAVCTHRDGRGRTCGAEARRTQRLIDGKPAAYDDPIILVGGSEAYEARCRRHHEVPGRKLD